MTYQETLAYIGSLSAYGIVPGLSNITNLCEKLGNPQDALTFIHIAGTNGKGSTLAYLSEIYKAAGYRVGRYLSPTIFSYRERIQVSKKERACDFALQNPALKRQKAAAFQPADAYPGWQFITKPALVRLVAQIKEACEALVAEGKPHPTPFEVETALAFLYFLEQKCDIVILETGMGGREDATNVIKNTKVAVFASIAYDHMAFLGDTLEEIAAQKAGIIKEGCAVVSLPQASEVREVLRREAARLKAPFKEVQTAKKGRCTLEKQTFSYDDMDKLTIFLAGEHQVENACLAIEAVRAYSQQAASAGQAAAKATYLADPAAAAPVKACTAPRSFKPVLASHIRTGLSRAAWPGRLQVMQKQPLFLLDGAHNPDAARKLAASLDFYFTNEKFVYIIGMLRDKAVQEVISIMLPYAAHIICITPRDNPRAMPAYDLAMAVREISQTSITAADSYEEAIEEAKLLAGPFGRILAFGSLSFLGDFTRMLKG